MRIAGFRKIIIRPDLQPDDPIGYVIHGRQEDHGRTPGSTDPSQDREAIFAWHDEIQNDAIECASSHGNIHAIAVGRSVDVEAVLLQECGDEIAKPAVVIDDEDARAPTSSDMLSQLLHDTRPTVDVCRNAEFCWIIRISCTIAYPGWVLL